MDTKWVPALDPGGPRYRALADAIGRAVGDGTLEAGDQLPPVRTLAWELGVTPGTVARAYRLADSRGVVDATVGRGTFIRGAEPSAEIMGAARAPTTDASAGGAPTSIDFVSNSAPDAGQGAAISAELAALVATDGPQADALWNRYRKRADEAPERAAAADWLRIGGLSADPDALVLTLGAQQGLCLALAATAGGGQGAVALTEALSYPGLIDAARALGVRLEPVEIDAEGMVPDALEAACQRYRPSAIILCPNLNNPTLAAASRKRREAIAEIAHRARTPIIEDDVYGWLRPAAREASLSEIAPDLTWYVMSLSKCAAAGLCAGVLKCPPGAALRADSLRRSLLSRLPGGPHRLMRRLIETDRLRPIVDSVADEVEIRASIAETQLQSAADASGARVEVSRKAGLIWLVLPDAWRARSFQEIARLSGVSVRAAEEFAVGRAPAPQAVRIALSAPSRDDIAAGLGRLAGMLRRGPAPEGGGA